MSELPHDSGFSSGKMPSLRADAVEIVRRLRQAGHVAYLAGGCVRDELLGLTPKDYDVATDAPPTRVQQLFAPRTQAVGAAFGVILVRVGRSQIEVATFRTDGQYSDGRRPDAVTFADAQHDARRRDFTINGLFLDPLDGDRVIDLVGGQADLAERVLRAIGDPQLRFAEDYLRMLRAVRFAARFGLTIEPATDDAIRQNSARLTEIAPERVADELRRALVDPTRGEAWRLMRRFGFDALIFRRFDAPPSPHAGETDFPVLPDGVTFGVVLAISATWFLIPRLPPAEAESLFDTPWVRRIVAGLRNTLRLSNEESAELEGTLSGCGILLKEGPHRVATLKRALARPSIAGTRLLLSALAAAGHHADRIAAAEAGLRMYEGTEFAPPPLVTGDDLVAAGMQPGPRFKRMLDHAYDEQLEGRLTTKEAALDHAKAVQ